ncbi:pyridoxamine 5'-phosphate oxidase [uncultured Bacteroides sp.]|uniref:pyridoxamine 5'-phosphate oxidase n=1 Tax=uncultured Bacteroides sp. TaxID=162156 RepID=UPI0025D7780C|nr:pyridoxamine 5'-phosphate oxidase [uncultured Bacteroides sp.]
MEIRISEIRKEYTKGKLTQCVINDNPFRQFEEWLNEAINSKEDEPTAMIVATVSAEGHPSTRTVLLKGLDNDKFIFFTNYESRKGRQLAGNPYISLSFVWHKLERQVHIEGRAEKCSGKVSDTYFANRPYKSKIGARISPQSRVINSRMEIMRAFVKEVFKLAGHEIKRPDNWGGFAVTPTRFEFWQGRENRLHDRIQYIPLKDGSWKQERLAP